MCETLMDVSNVFCDVFAQTSFDSFDSFAGLLHQFMNRTGYIYRIKSSCSVSDHNKYRDKTRSQALRYASVTFVCTQYGEPKDNANTKRLKRHCNPVGCKSFLSLSSAKGILRVTKSNLEHNHKPLVGSLRYITRRCTLSKKDIEEVAALNQHKSKKYKVYRKRKQPTSATVPTLSDSHLLSPAAKNQTEHTEQNLKKKYKYEKNVFNDGQTLGGDNVSQMVEKPQESPQISVPNSIPEVEKAEYIAQRVQFSIPSVQNVVSQPKPVEKPQLPKKGFGFGNHKMSNLASIWKNGKLCDSSVDNSSPTVMARSLNQNKANKSVSLHQRISPPVSSTPVIIPDEPHCQTLAAKLPKRQIAANAFDKHSEKEQYCQENTSVGRQSYRDGQARSSNLNNIKYRSDFPNKTPPISSARCIDLDDLPPTAASSIQINDRQIIGGSHVSKMAGKPQEIPSQIPVQNPICMIEDVKTVPQLIQFSTLPVSMPIMFPQSIEIPQPQGKKIFILADHQKNVMSNLALLWKNGKLCDAGIGNGLSTVMIHKVVLAALCPKLLSVFGADMLSEKFLQINLPEEVSTEALNAFAEYMYNGILDLDPDILHQLKIIAKQLDMKEFEQLCNSQLATTLYHPHYSQMQPNVSMSSNITTTPVRPSFSFPLTQSKTLVTNNTHVIDIKDEISEAELIQHKENTDIAFRQESEVVSIDVSKNSNSNGFVIVPSGQTESVEPEDSIYSQQNHNVSYTPSTNSSISQIPYTTSDSSAAVSQKVLVVPFSDSTDSRATSNMVQKSNIKSSASESSLGYDLSPVSCIVQKMCSQPSLIGRNFYKPSVRTITNRKGVCSLNPSTSREKTLSLLSPQINDVVSIDLTDELT